MKKLNAQTFADHTLIILLQRICLKRFK